MLTSSLPERYESYSGLHSARATPVVAHTFEELSTIVLRATESGRRVTPRGSGLSFDTQALGGDLSLSIRPLAHITVDSSARTATIGAGARWRDVLAATLPRGLVPPVLVSAGDSTLGGTLSANCHSRLSPTLGKEGRHVRSMKLVTADGNVLSCSRTENPELFHGAIGGFAMLGVIAEATINLFEIGIPAQVETRVRRHTDITDLARLIRPGAFAREDDDAPWGVYSVIALTDNSARMMVSDARSVSGRRSAPMLPHQPSHPVTLPVQLLIHRFPALGQSFWNYAFDHYVREDQPYVDDLTEYTFMMDGHTRARSLALRFGGSFRSIQASHVIPGGEGSVEGAALMDFLASSLANLRAKGHRPALVDVLWLPRDEAFGLSSTRNEAGYVVTFSFSAPQADRLPSLESNLVDLTELAIGHGGRTNLVKNVHATADQARRMYGVAADALFALKAIHDPRGTFGNALIDRLFPTR